MKTETHISNRSLGHGMKEKDKHNSPTFMNREEGVAPEYNVFLEKSRCGQPSFDAFVEAVCEVMQTYDNIDPYQKDALKPITDKADAFLKRHTTINYEKFLRQSTPENFTEDDYGELPEKTNLKTRLFEYRAMLYLSSLDVCERNGNNLDEVLGEIEKRTIPYLKRKPAEPTFLEILKILGK